MQSCIIITAIYFENNPITQKEALYPLSIPVSLYIPTSNP